MSVRLIRNPTVDGFDKHFKISWHIHYYGDVSTYDLRLGFLFFKTWITKYIC